MKGEDLLQAMDGLQEDVLERNMKEALPRKKSWAPALLAACLALAVGLGALWNWNRQPEPPSGAPGQVQLLQNPGWQGMGMTQQGEVPDESRSMLAGHQSYYQNGLVVLCRAVEVLPDVYETVAPYGSMEIWRLRVFQMQVIDGLDTGITGDFWFAIPDAWYEDLTQYETLMISLGQLGPDFLLQNTRTLALERFDLLFWETWPFYGDIIAFRDGIFDESLWACESWEKANALRAWEHLDYDHCTRIVSRGDSIEDVLQVIEERRQDEKYKPATLYTNNVSGDAAQALEYIQSLEQGSYIPKTGFSAKQPHYTRYIGGCPTNEYIIIDRENNTAEYSEFRFTQEDLQNLPDVAGYVRSLNLDALSPPNRDVEGRDLLFRGAYGWYEKTDKGVLAFVKVIWMYDYEGYGYIYDDLYIQLTLDGTQVRTRDQMLDILGENSNIYTGSYDDDIVSGFPKY